VIRPARPADVPAVLGLVRDLAAYERAADEVRMTVELLDRGLFGDAPVVSCHVACRPAAGAAGATAAAGAAGDGLPAGHGDSDGDVVGCALWFVTFSTWTGLPGMYLEDLFVRPEHRGEGHGRALLSTLAGVCVERGYARLEWSVLDWNTPAIGFYRSIGAQPQSEWQRWRLSGDPLATLGSKTAIRA
jgi:GNAT superfamily N-acetyltransferase